MHDEFYIPHQLSKTFNEAYRYFSHNERIPDEITTRLSEFTVDLKTFQQLVTIKEAKFVYLKDGRICFDEYTLPPHGAVIGEVLGQISAQNVPKILMSGTGDGVFRRWNSH